jgi:hypothetical protein
MDSPLGTPSLDSASCHISSPLNTPVTPIEIEDTSVTPIEIEDVEIKHLLLDLCQLVVMVVVDDHHSLGKKEMFQTNLQHGTISLEIKVPLMMIP